MKLKEDFSIRYWEWLLHVFMEMSAVSFFNPKVFVTDKPSEILFEMRLGNSFRQSAYKYFRVLWYSRFALNSLSTDGVFRMLQDSVDVDSVVASNMM